MMYKKSIDKWGLLLVSIVLCSQTCFAQHFDYYPTSSTQNTIDHSFYRLSYSEAHEQAEWVAYELFKGNIGGKEKRTRFCVY